MTVRPLRRVLLAVVVVLALAGIYGLARIGHPASKLSRTAGASRVDVSSAVRVCPGPGSTGPTESALAVASVPGSAAPGSAVVTPLSPVGSASAGTPLITLTHPGVLQASSVPVAPALTAAEQAGLPGSSPSVRTVPGRGGVQVSATGALAQGLEVEQTGAGGIATAQCGSPGTSFWFAGPGQKSAATIELYLTNTGNAPADAQVQVVTDAANGPPVLGNADNGITVPPHGMVVQSLGGLLQGSGIMALNVSTTVGQVVAAVWETKSAGAAGSWLPALQAPARHLVIPGLPGGPGSRDLYIAVPGSGAAQVKLTAITQRGSYQPTGGTGIDLLGGSVSNIPLPSMAGVAGALSITSSVPVVAMMLVPGGSGGSVGALAASAGPVLEQGVLSANPAGSAGSGLVLSAPGKAASVRIATATATAPASATDGQVVHVAAKSSLVVQVGPPAGSKATQFTLVVTPLAGSGPIYAGRVISSGGLVQSTMPVPSSLTWIPLPGVSESLSAILGGS